MRVSEIPNDEVVTAHRSQWASTAHLKVGALVSKLRLEAMKRDRLFVELGRDEESVTFRFEEREEP